METSTPSGNSTRRIAILVVAVAFIAGALIGFAGGRVYSLLHGPMPRHRGDFVSNRIIEHLDDALDLTPQQHEQIESIMKRHHQRMMALSEGVRPQMHQEIEAANREVEALLTPKQREKFQKMRMRMRFLPHGPGPGGPPPHDGPPPHGF